MQWIGSIAKQCGDLRKKGLEQEALQLEEDMKKVVYACDGIHLGCTNGFLGEGRNR
jgi:hypothetical protein